MRTLDTEVLVIGSGAGGGITAAHLADAGRQVTVVEEGPWVDADALEPFSLEAIVTSTAITAHRWPSATPTSPTPRGAAWGAAPR